MMLCTKQTPSDDNAVLENEFACDNLTHLVRAVRDLDVMSDLELQLSYPELLNGGTRLNLTDTIDLHRRWARQASNVSFQSSGSGHSAMTRVTLGELKNAARDRLLRRPVAGTNPPFPTPIPMAARALRSFHRHGAEFATTELKTSIDRSGYWGRRGRPQAHAWAKAICQCFETYIAYASPDPRPTLRTLGSNRHRGGQQHNWRFPGHRAPRSRWLRGAVHPLGQARSDTRWRRVASSAHRTRTLARSLARTVLLELRFGTSEAAGKSSSTSPLH